MIKKIILVAAVLSILGGSLVVLAETTTPPMPTTISAPNSSTTLSSQQMILQVGPEGKVLLRGTINSVSTGLITVKSWGGDWNINTPSTTQILSATSNTIQLKIGDFVIVQGTVSKTAKWTIDATSVRNLMGATIETKGTVNNPASQVQRTLPAQIPQQLVPSTHEGQSGSPASSVMNQGVQQQIQSILEQIKKIQAQIDAQRSLSSTSATQAGQ